jgi:hypothetical protein
MRRKLLLMGVALAGLGTSPSARAVATTTVASENGCAGDAALDAVVAAPGNHKVLFENERVRLLDVVVEPGSREPVHAHCWPSVLYVMSRGRRREYNASGQVVSEVKETPPASAFPIVTWLDPGPPHALENLDAQPIHLLRFELKQ